ncbi:hypothetical protein FACS1894151_00370 [Spirochaetia bacterium]|nr:hypothetical protein FACS1894151_00370 [Spirochaetia bacterium]
MESKQSIADSQRGYIPETNFLKEQPYPDRAPTKLVMRQGLVDFICAELGNRNVFFVFPSAVPARFWAGEAALRSGVPVAAERFTAWDTFKEETLSVKQTEKKPVNNALRTLFASGLLAENMKSAAKPQPLLTEYINPLYAHSWNGFTSDLARTLPALDNILREKKMLEKNLLINNPAAERTGYVGSPDVLHSGFNTQDTPQSGGVLNPSARINGFDDQSGYFADLGVIWKHYSDFLDEHKLYEPSWNRSAFVSPEKKWLLFFPELAEDWEEYRAELEENAANNLWERNGRIKIVPLSMLKAPSYTGKNAEEIQKILNFSNNRFIQFASSAAEYRALALIIKQLLTKGALQMQDICISSAEQGNLERLLQELYLLDIPVDSRRGRPLPEYPGGRIFASLAACPSEKWSFNALKNLLLDKAYPWKESAMIDALMEAGLRFRCVSGYEDSGKNGNANIIDVWERSFQYHKNMRFAEMEVTGIASFYRDLKRDISGIVNADSFSGILQQWRIFEGRYFDRQSIKDETDKILARAVKALGELIEMEKQFPELSGNGNAFSVFQSYIAEVKYVYQSKQQNGVSLYNYKVAAGIAPAVHFIVNVSQRDASVLYDGGASFLREDRRSLLGISERDVSSDFLRAYAVSAAFPVFTVSERTFSGPAVPHHRLYEIAGKPLYPGIDFQLPADPWQAEAFVSAGGTVILNTNTDDHSAGAAYPSDIQKKGWAARQITVKEPHGLDLRIVPVKDELLRETLKQRLGNQRGAKHETPQISPTDLNEYLECPFKWLLQRCLLIQEKHTEIETIDQREMGILYHRILQRLFLRIQEKEQNNEKKFYRKNIDTYKKYLDEEIDTALDEAWKSEGAFQQPVYDMLKNRIAASLSAYLEQDAENLDGDVINGAEVPLRKYYENCGAALSGIADLVLERDDGSFVLTDFKTRVIPDVKDLFCSKEKGSGIPEDLQMASYIAMIETADKKAGTARFYSIDDRKFRPVISEEYTRDGYDREIAAVDMVFEKVIKDMETGNYAAPGAEKQENCGSCRVSSVCRMPFIGGKSYAV